MTEKENKPKIVFTIYYKDKEGVYEKTFTKIATIFSDYDGIAHIDPYPLHRNQITIRLKKGFYATKGKNKFISILKR